MYDKHLRHARYGHSYVIDTVTIEVASSSNRNIVLIDCNCTIELNDGDARIIDIVRDIADSLCAESGSKQHSDSGVVNHKRDVSEGVGIDITDCSDGCKRSRHAAGAV
jgi:hypothetical protein